MVENTYGKFLITPLLLSLATDTRCDIGSSAQSHLGRLLLGQSAIVAILGGVRSVFQLSASKADSERRYEEKPTCLHLTFSYQCTPSRKGGEMSRHPPSTPSLSLSNLSGSAPPNFQPCRPADYLNLPQRDHRKSGTVWPWEPAGLKSTSVLDISAESFVYSVR